MRPSLQWCSKLKPLDAADAPDHNSRTSTVPRDVQTKMDSGVRRDDINLPVTHESMFEPDQLKRIVEAALLASTQPLSLPQISSLFDELDMPPQGELARALARLQDECAGRGVELVEVASGFRYQVCQDVHPFVARLWSERQTRYSRALLETLSLIAYRQPITRPEIEQIRGVAVSTHIVRTLEEREWVRIVGYRDLPGKPALFGTTRQFLDYFNLKSLDQLPPLGELRDIDEPDPQLAFGAPGGTIPASASVSIDDDTAPDDDDADADASSIDADIESVRASSPHGGGADEPDSIAANSGSEPDGIAANSGSEPDGIAANSGDAPSSLTAGAPTGAAEHDTPESVA